MTRILITALALTGLLSIVQADVAEARNGRTHTVHVQPARPAARRVVTARPRRAVVSRPRRVAIAPPIRIVSARRLYRPSGWVWAAPAGLRLGQPVAIGQRRATVVQIRPSRVRVRYANGRTSWLVRV